MRNEIIFTIKIYILASRLLIEVKKKSYKFIDLITYHVDPILDPAVSLEDF